MTKYRRGAERERKLMKFLIKKGFAHSMRSAGSKGLIDVVGFCHTNKTIRFPLTNGTYVLCYFGILFQVKDYTEKKKKPEKEFKALKVALPKVWASWKKYGKGWEFERVE